MKTLTLIVAGFCAFAAFAASANPAIGYSIASGPSQGPGTVVHKPKTSTPAPQQQPLMAAPQLLKQQGTHPSMNSEIPVRRHRGPVGSLNVTLDIQARPAF